MEDQVGKPATGPLVRILLFHFLFVSSLYRYSRKYTNQTQNNHILYLSLTAQQRLGNMDLGLKVGKIWAGLLFLKERAFPFLCWKKKEKETNMNYYNNRSKHNHYRNEHDIHLRSDV